MFQGCKKATAPELTTVAISEIGLTTAVSGGVITSDGGEDILQKGVCWSTSPSPTIADQTTNDGDGTTNYASAISGLTEKTPYYVRAYATNSVGTAYGNELTFTTNQVTGAIVTTTEVTSVTSTTAVAGGNVTDAGGGSIIAGVCWNTAPNPTPSINKTTDGTAAGTFTSNITGLTDGVTYYYRAYATNSTGTTYGQEYQFITPVTDIDGNLYKTVKIGTQVWMAENLKVTKFTDNTEIDYVSDNTAWSTQNSSAYCWYNNDENYFKPLYGALYNWYAVNSGSLCPDGWHVPTDEEFGIMELSLGITQAQVDALYWRGTDQGSKLKNTTGWNSGENGTNTSGFSALPSGYRYYSDGSFYGQSSLGYWWSASTTILDETIVWYRRLDGIENGIYRASTEKRAGKSVRCVKD